MEFDEKGNQLHKLYTHETPTIRGGNRFTYFPPVIDFSYQAVLDSLSDAIEKEGEINNATIVDKIETTIEETVFSDVRMKAQELWTKLVGENEENAAIILKKIEMIMGRKMKLSEFTEDQKDLLALVVTDMEEM